VTRAGFLVFGLLLAGCGAQRDLQPAAGATLPAAAVRPRRSADCRELLEPTPEAQPVRTVELRRQSEEREDDPFDLPPEG
jgi:hypothetical protein